MSSGTELTDRSLVTAARTSVVLFRQALNVGDLAGAETHRMDIEVVRYVPTLTRAAQRWLTSRMALAQFGTRFKIGFHHAQLIEYFFDRASNPTLEKLAAHYPEHPRPGAPELGPNSDLGRCIINALNIKRGYWRLPRSANSGQAASGISPFESTPESSGSASGTGSGSGSSNLYTNPFQGNFSERWSEGNSPTGANPFLTSAPGLGPGLTGTGGTGMGYGSTQYTNPYLATMGGNANSNEVLMKEMAQKIGSGDGFGSGSGQYHVQPVSGAFSDSYSWSVSGKVDLGAEPPLILESDGRDGGIKPLCYKEG